MRYKNQIFIKILILYNLYLYLLYNLILNAYRKVVKISNNRKFYIIYLIFCIEQVIKMTKIEKSVCIISQPTK